MTVFCPQCNSNTHAAEWHTFAYRRDYLCFLKLNGVNRRTQGITGVRYLKEGV